jgi:hypothetical protein
MKILKQRSQLVWQQSQHTLAIKHSRERQLINFFSGHPLSLDLHLSLVFLTSHPSEAVLVSRQQTIWEEKFSFVTTQSYYCHRTATSPLSRSILCPSPLFSILHKAYSFYDGIIAPTLLVTGGLIPLPSLLSSSLTLFVSETGWPVLYPEEYDRRKAILEQKVHPLSHSPLFFIEHDRVSSHMYIPLDHITFIWTLILPHMSLES